ncbi:MAG: hypothetical protein Q8K30_06780 [Candidatus Gracilibacteria bacterium]|nr:hypothetical protein [Candidatus Gracilibacteria bacterium]
MKKILIIILLFISLVSNNNTYASGNVNNDIQKWFSNYARKISAKNTNQKEILYFKGFSNNLNEILTKKKLNEIQINLVYDLIKLSNEHIFSIELEQDEILAKTKLHNNELLSDFKYFSYNSHNIFLENGVWYTYNYDKHLVFPAGTNIKKSDLEFNKINPKNSIVFLKSDGNLGFLIDYKKVKLISDDIIFGVSDKYSFLKEIKDDKKKLNTETDELFKKLKQDSINLTKGKTKDLKIKGLYDYVLNNLEYPKTFSLEDYRIFSGIDSFKNKLGVCEGYTKMFKYMLNFSYINSVEVNRGYVIDAQDFPKVGHAWIKIGNDYYDPTFDDPIGIPITKTFDQYYYYSLPKDLFFTNRYDFDKLPEYLKNKDLEFRKGIINQKTLLLLSKYNKSGYNLLKPYLIKLNNGIKVDKKIDIEDLKTIITYSEVDNLKVSISGKNKNIASLSYYIIESSSLESMLEQLDYNLDGYYLFKWKLDNGGYDYRLAYNVIFN